MKTHIISIVKVLFLTVVLGACDTDEEVYQVTDRADAYISSVQLYTAYLITVNDCFDVLSQSLD